VHKLEKYNNMESNKIVRKQIFEIIEDQIKNNNPPETNLTFNRLIKDGYNKSDTKKLIAQCVAIEIFDVIKYGNTFDEKRFIKNLKQLPKEPFD
jgi:hypothetical protein